jgi:hypothetical protein
MRGRFGRRASGQRVQERKQNHAAFAEALKIAHHEPEIRVTANNGTSRQFYTDGRKARHTAPNGESIETTTHWQGEQLIVVNQRAKGMKSTQTYTLAQGGRQMIVSTQITHPRLDRPIELRLVYDANTAAGSNR